jgi:hypothetical protein
MTTYFSRFLNNCIPFSISYDLISSIVLPIKSLADLAVVSMMI